MKLKTLTIIVAILTGVSILSWFFESGPEAPEADARVGTSLVDDPTIEKTASVFIRANGSEITLKSTDTGDSPWLVQEYHDLPVDFKKLSTLVQNLRDAKVMRFASANADRIAKMDFGDSIIELRDDGGEPLLSVELGRTLSSGGRFVKFSGEDKAYVASLSAALDTTPKNWANTALVPVDQAKVTRFEIGFESDEPLVVTRQNGDSPWASEGLTDDATLNAGAINSLLKQVTGLRFTETADPDSEKVVHARDHARTFTLGIDDGSSYTVSIGREPAPPAPPPEPTDGDATATPPPAPKAGPVFVFVESSDTGSEFNNRMKKLGYEVSEWTFTGMPDNRSAFITLAAPQQPATATPPIPMPAPETPVE
jgi:hypothetical protein